MIRSSCKSPLSSPILCISQVGELEEKKAREGSVVIVCARTRAFHYRANWELWKRSRGRGFTRDPAAWSVSVSARLRACWRAASEKEDGSFRESEATIYELTSLKCDATNAPRCTRTRAYGWWKQNALYGHLCQSLLVAIYRQCSRWQTLI